MHIDRRRSALALVALGAALAAPSTAVFGAGHRVLALGLVAAALLLVIAGLLTLREVADRQSRAPARRHE